MTKRKANPRKGGRPPVPPRVYAALLLRWGVFRRKAKAKNPHRRDPNIAADFMAAEQPWFSAHRISTLHYPTLANMLTKGRSERERVASRRRRAWRIISPLTGRRLCTNPAVIAAWRNALLAANPELK